MQTQTLNIALPREMVQKIDLAARKEYRNRSELIREAVRIYLRDMEQWERIYKIGENAMREMGIRQEEEVNERVYEYRHSRQSR